MDCNGAKNEEEEDRQQKNPTGKCSQTSDKSHWIYVKHDKSAEHPIEKYCLDNN